MKKQNSLIISDLSVSVEPLTEEDMSMIVGGEKTFSQINFTKGNGNQQATNSSGGQQLLSGATK